MNCAWWQHELSREGGSSLGCTSEVRACRYAGHLNPFAPVLPTLFFLFWVFKRYALGGRQPPFHVQGQARYSTDTLHPAGAGARHPLGPRRGFLCRCCLRLSFLCLQVLGAGDKHILLLRGLCCACKTSVNSHVPSVHLSMTPKPSPSCHPARSCAVLPSITEIRENNLFI